MASATVKLTGSGAFQDIGTVGQTVSGLSGNVQSINQILDVGLRNTSNIKDSFLRVSDLVGLGLATLNGNVLTAATLTGGTFSLTVGGNAGIDDIEFTGATVTASGATATVAVTGGGGTSEPFNITPDTHTSTAAFPANDEFEYGSSLDLTGARASGATAWSWAVQDVATTVVTQGGLVFSSSSGGDFSSAVQPAPGSGAWVYRCKAYNPGSNFVGLFLYNSANSKIIAWGFSNNGAVAAYQLTLPNSFGSSLIGSTSVPANQPLYFEIDYDGASNLTFKMSYTGYAGTFVTMGTTTVGAWLGALTGIGICGFESGLGVFDWFRRIS